MDSGRIRRLKLSLTNEDLDTAIELLGAFDPGVLHPRAWAGLMTERERRRDGAPPQDIDMMSGVFETLPSVVQGLLRHHVGAGTGGAPATLQRRPPRKVHTAR
jgi:hypothetical protein